MSRKVFLIFGILILSSGLSFVIYSFLQMKSNEEAENEALQKAKASIMENPSVQKGSEPITSTQTSIDYYFEKGDVIGVLHIPRLERDVAIIEGTDGEELKKGVGHYSSTSLPEQNDQIFLAGHRDTVFRDIGELQHGDILSIGMPTGTYSYEIFKTYIVDESDTSVIRTTRPEEILTLSTCYPFSLLGASSERYIIEARRIH
ncbi:MAG: class D sortase [Bacillota bacterium]